MRLTTRVVQVDSSCVVVGPRDDEQLSRELSAVLKTLTLNLSSTEEEKPVYWTRVTKRINTLFFVFYLLAVVAFLVWIFCTWTAEENIHRKVH